MKKNMSMYFTMFVNQFLLIFCLIGAKAMNAAFNASQEMLNSAGLANVPQKIREAISLGANVNQGNAGNSALSLAILLKHPEATDELIKAGADIKGIVGRNLVYNALKLLDVKSAIILIKNGADFSGCVDEINRNAMDYAIEFIMQSRPFYDDDLGNRVWVSTDVLLTLVQELINHGYSINSKACLVNIWWQALRMRVQCNQELLGLFIKNGADPDQTIDSSQLTSGTSWTPLLLAIENHNAQAVEFLLGAGADVNKKAFPVIGHGAYSPLAYAIEKHDSATVKLLAERGAKL